MCCEAEQQEYFDYVGRQAERVQRRHEEINLMRWKKVPASKKALQSRAWTLLSLVMKARAKP